MANRVGTAGKVGAALAAGVAVGLAADKARKLAIQSAGAAAGDWFDILKAEHRAVEALFLKLEETSNDQASKRTALFAKIKLALSKHAFQEENVVYPALRKADPEGAARKLNEDHFDIKSLLSDTEQLPKNHSKFMTAMKKLRAVVAAHVKEEEDVVFPAFHAGMAGEANAKLTALMQKEGMKLV
jgi:hemerythrin superfamily protein